MREQQFPETIRQHIREAQSKDGERALFDKLRRYYRGEFWAGKGESSESALQKMSTNLLFAVIDTGLATLVPSNPMVEAKARSPKNQDLIANAEDIANLAFDAGAWRRELRMAAFSAMLYRRAITKTVWNPATDLPLVRSLDIRNVFFDIVAQRPEDIRYWVEATLVGEREFERRVKQGKYAATEDTRRQATTYPKWMIETDQNGRQDMTDEKLRNYQQWYLIYECYDVEEGQVLHFVADEAKPIFKNSLSYLPYDLVTLNTNGEDNRGLGDAELILANQEEYNLLATYLHNLVRFQIGKMGYDANALDGEAAQDVQRAPLGSLVPFRIKQEFRNQNPAVRGTDLVWELPTVHATAEQFDLRARLREDISFTSALADAQRGQTVGAKTATELALIEGQLRNRLKSRQDALDELTENVAAKCLLLASRYMKEEKVMEITGASGWKTINPYNLEGLEARFKIKAYSPAESNKAVRAEIMRSLIGAFANNPLIDQRNFFGELLKLLDLPASILASPEAVAAALAPPGGAPGGPPGGAPGGPPGAPAPGGAPAPEAAPGPAEGDATLPPQVEKLASAQVQP